jgi:hypothetical protein
VLLVMKEGDRLDEHSAPGPITLSVHEGRIRFSLGEPLRTRPLCKCPRLPTPWSMPHAEARRISTEAYSPKCRERAFSELRDDGVLGSSQHPATSKQQQKSLIWGMCCPSGLRRVVVSYITRTGHRREFPLLSSKPARSFSLPFTPKRVEEAFCELRLSGVLGSSKPLMHQAVS